MDMDIEIPEYFICPISLQIMKDPVTAVTGITYDRQSIEHWLFDADNSSTCPVTNQHLPPDSDLTPNHNLRRLIQAWCSQNADHGVDRIPTPKPPLTKLHVIKLLKDLNNPHLQLTVLTNLQLLAAENERNRKHMADAGIGNALISFVVTCHNQGRHVPGLEEAVTTLHLVRNIPTFLPEENELMIIESLTWTLTVPSENRASLKSHAICVIQKIVESASSGVLDRLRPEFFKRIVTVLRDEEVTRQGINAALRIMIHACPWGRNRAAAVEAGAVFEAVELELRAAPEEQKTTELALGALFQLCCCASGRAEFLSHGAGVAVVAKRMLRVSPAADEQAILILSTICKYSCNQMVALEMLNVGAVMKLLAMLQVECAAHLKNKVSGIIRSHYEEWKSSPCIGNSNLLTKYIK